MYLNKKLRRKLPSWLVEQVADKDVKDDERCVTQLYATLKGLDPKVRDKIVNKDSRDVVARDLAYWWEVHQVIDTARELRREREEKERNKLKMQALKKLTSKERKVLGF